MLLSSVCIHAALSFSTVTLVLRDSSLILSSGKPSLCFARNTFSIAMVILAKLDILCKVIVISQAVNLKLVIFLYQKSSEHLRKMGPAFEIWQHKSSPFDLVFRHKRAELLFLAGRFFVFLN